MSDTHSISSGDGSPHLPFAPASFRAPPLTAYSHPTPLSPWVPALSGYLAAEIFAYLFCRLPAPHTQTLGKLLFRALVYVALIPAVGALAVAYPWSLRPRKPRLRPAILIQLVGAGWLFFPAVALLNRQHSSWIILAVAIASVPVAFSLNHLSAITNPPPSATPFSHRRELSTLYGLPAAEPHTATNLLMSLCLCGALVLAFNSFFVLSAALVATAIFLAVWRWCSLAPRRPVLAGSHERIQFVSFAVLLTFFSLIVWYQSSGVPGRPGIAALAHKSPPAESTANAKDRFSSGYFGIILLPPPLKKNEIIAPPDTNFASRFAHISKPVVISFDGPYWYFKAPNKRPGPNAHIAHGIPTNVNVRSTDEAPLLMEARQDLGTPIDLDCCSGIDLNIINADTHPGAIALGVLLTDSTSPGSPSLFLGQHPILSTEASIIPPGRPPIPERLHFTIPPAHKLRRFNKITVFYLPDFTRAVTGAKVSIQTFVLLPR